MVVESLENQHTQHPKTPSVQTTWQKHNIARHPQKTNRNAAQDQSSFSGEGGKPEPKLSPPHPKQTPTLLLSQGGDGQDLEHT